HDVPVEHHERQPAIPFQRVQRVEVEDRLLLGGLQPVVARHPRIVLVGLAVAVLPVVPFARADADPQQEAADREGGLGRPVVDEIDDGVARVVGNPGATQGSPSSFFSWTCSSMSSAKTSFLRWSFSSKAAILLSLASGSAARRLPAWAKAAVPFSKNCFCQR